MSLVSDIVDALKDLSPANLEKIKSVATTVVADLTEVNKDIEVVLSVIPPSILSKAPEVERFESEFTAVLSVVAEALAALP